MDSDGEKERNGVHGWEQDRKRGKTEQRMLVLLAAAGRKVSINMSDQT